MRRVGKFILVLAVIGIMAIFTLPLWGMGPAILLDSDRTILSAHASPDGRLIAQIERFTVGGAPDGVPSIVVIVRPWWAPNWYIAGCAAASHYQEASARLVWTGNMKLQLMVQGDPSEWTIGSAPFHNGGCPGLSLALAPAATVKSGRR
ncbi:MAG: hypothetical protein WC729_04210 [Sphingomonas sp.]|jgi:hypothetical protein|uniref:hypothetical protein n=1 Tax=Sphingomonas sp. TaxID=28214 RepID=UPI003564B1B3